MALQGQNNTPRSPATIEFDKKLEKMYMKLLKEFERSFHKSMANFDFDITKVIIPSSSEMKDETFARKFNKRRNKILDSVDQLVRSMVVSRNKISIADMFDSTVSNADFSKRYNKVRRIALNRLETGIGLLKFERHADLPFSTFLFPSRSSELYIVRYNILKHRILSKVAKGVKNLSFVAETFKGRLKSKVFLEREKAEVPIDSFLIPTPNSNLFTIRYNWLKHKMLDKAYYGIKHLSFVAESFKGRVKSRIFLERQKAEIPLDSFLIPSGNSIFYNVRYELLKLKLLGKIKSGIRHLSFKKNEEIDILKYFFPSEEESVYDPIFKMEIVDEFKKGIRKQFNELKKGIRKQSNERAHAIRRESKANEFAIHREQKRKDKELRVRIKTNKTLENMYKVEKSTNRIIDMRLNKKTGIFEQRSSSAGDFATAIGNKLLMFAPQIGKAMGVAAAAYGGYKLGQFIDRKLGTSEAIGELAGMHAESKGYKEYVKNIVDPGLERDSDTKFIYNQLMRNIESKGEKLKGAHGKALLYDKARELAKQRMQERESQFLAMGYTDYTIADLRSLKPVDYIVKTARNEPITLGPGIPMPAGAADYFMQGTSNLNMPGMQTLIELQAENNKMMKNMQGTTIINSRSNNDFNLSGQSLDFSILWY